MLEPRRGADSAQPTREMNEKAPAEPPTTRWLGGRRPTWLVLPAAVLLVVVVLLPALLGVYLSFFNVNLTNLTDWVAAPFVGLANYGDALVRNSLYGTAAHALAVSLEFACLATAIATPIGVLVALSVSHRFRGRAAFRSWFLVPYVIPGVVTATVARTMFINGTGLVDRVLGFLGGNGQAYWLLGSKTFWAMLATEVWSVWPFTYLLVLAGLTSVPQELYDAAELDGAGYRAKLTYVVFPQIKSVLLLSILLSTIFHLSNFTLPFVMFGNPPPSNVEVLPINIYYQAFTSSQYSLAAATSVLMVLVLAVPGWVYLHMTRLRTGDAR